MEYHEQQYHKTWMMIVMILIANFLKAANNPIVYFDSLAVITFGP